MSLLVLSVVVVEYFNLRDWTKYSILYHNDLKMSHEHIYR